MIDRTLEVIDNSSKQEDENTSSYSAYFQLDNLQPSKKGTRESVSFHVKVSLCPNIRSVTGPNPTDEDLSLIPGGWITKQLYVPGLDTLGPSSSCFGNNQEMMRSIFKIQLNGGYEFTTSLQIKIYKANSTQHCDWGTTVHSIEYECHTDQQNNCIKIIKDTFRWTLMRSIHLYTMTTTSPVR